MAANHLKLNDSKTEVIVLTSASAKPSTPIDSIMIGDCSVTPTECVRNLGVMFDCHMTMRETINRMCASSYLHLHNIASIRDSLTEEATVHIIHAFVTSRIDYCNSLLYGLPEQAIKSIQRVQNMAARIVLRKSKPDSGTDMLKKLHWLPVKQRIAYKISLLTFKALHGIAPSYLQCLLHHYVPARSLRSESANLLIVPKSLKKQSSQGFKHAAPTLWNELPISLRQTDSLSGFKAALKTFLFRQAFST